MSHAVLIGPDQQENLALRYLAAAGERAGHQVELVPFCQRDEIDAVCRRVIAAAPDLVGLGIAFQYSVDDFITLVAELRDRGYGHHITGGGHVPTFCYRELLDDAPGLDSVVRGEGEVTWVEMLDAIDRKQPVTQLAGLVWRDGEAIVVGPGRAPLTDLDELPHPTRRAEPYVVGGVPIGFLITARGCVGECTYCSIRALAAAAGGPAYRMRDPAAVAEEIAELRQQKGVRVIFVQDDLFLLPRPSQTIERMAALTGALRQRGVDDVAFWIKGRPETVTPAVLEAARAMGVLHLFLGVESASHERLRYLGRSHRPEDNRQAIAWCRDHGIMPSFNFMLFDPDCSLADVAASLELAADNLDLPWNLCRTEIYSGTPLLARLAEQGRLRGDYRSYGYVMADRAAEVMFRILRVCFHERALAFDSLLNRLISLSFARQVHDHLFPGETSEVLGKAVENLVIEVHQDSLAVLREVLDFATRAALAEEGAIRGYAIEQALQVNARDARWRVRTEDLWQRLHARGGVLLGHGGASGATRLEPPGG